MDKGFDLQLRWGLLANFPNVLQGHFSRQNDPAGTQVVPGVGGLVVADAGLGGDVLLHVGGVLLGQPEGTQVGHDDGGDAGVVQHFQPSGQFLHLVAPGHGVDGHMGVHPVGFAIADGLVQLVLVKVPGEGTHPEGGACQIHRVRPVGHGHFQPLHIASRSQQFDLSFLH